MAKKNMLIILTLMTIFTYVLSKTVLNKAVESNVHSDAIVTYWPSQKPPTVKVENVKKTEEDEPGFVRRTLMRFGEVASKIGNAMGSHATKITQAIDKICDVIKTIIPLLAAICHVGQYKFCAATTQGPGELSEAMNPTSLDLDSLDR